MEPETILKRLVAFRTLTGNRKEARRCGAWIRKFVKGLSVFIREVRHGGFPSLLITTRRTNTPTLWLAAHLDVVPGSPALFRPRVQGRKLISRGVFDMKFAAACYLALLRDLGAALPRYDFGVMLTNDEETGGAHGVGYLLGAGHHSRFAVLPDGGSHWQIERGAKGVWQFKIRSLGVPAHGSRPWLGVNAIEELMRFLRSLQELFPKEPCGDRAHVHATMNVGKIEGGTALNQIPHEAAAFVDVRFTSLFVRRRIARGVARLLHEMPRITLETLAEADPFRVNLRHPWIRLFSRIAQERFGIRAGSLISHGTSDARYFAAHGIPALVTRIAGGGHHTEGEWIDRRDLRRFFEALKEFVIRTAQV